jgi:SAM-dependent methyltransferase
MSSPCIICGKSFPPVDMGEKNAFRFKACAACGSVTTDPAVTAGQLDDFYAQVAPVITHEPKHEKAISRIAKSIAKYETAPSGKIFLDINCNQGYGVAAARSLGFSSCTGITPYAFYADFARASYGEGDFLHVSAADYAAQGRTFDFILCTAGFCQAPDPAALATAITKMLKPGGMAYIDEPNGNSMWLPGKFSKWDFAQPPFNFIYPSFEGLKGLLKRNGLAVEKRRINLGPYMQMTVRKNHAAQRI